MYECWQIRIIKLTVHRLRKSFVRREVGCASPTISEGRRMPREMGAAEQRVRTRRHRSFAGFHRDDGADLGRAILWEPRGSQQGGGKPETQMGIPCRRTRASRPPQAPRERSIRHRLRPAATHLRCVGSKRPRIVGRRRHRCMLDNAGGKEPCC